MPSFTKMAIKKTFVKLLNEKPLNQITVKDIVEECGINRNSFYYHFQDIPALIEEIVMEEADRIMVKYPSIDSLEMCLNAAIDFAMENKRAILHIYHSVSRSLFEQYLWKVCHYVIAKYAATIFADKAIRESDRSMIMRFYECVCFGIVIDWMNNGMPDNIHQELGRLYELKKGMIEEMIDRSLEN